MLAMLDEEILGFSTSAGNSGLVLPIPQKMNRQDAEDAKLPEPDPELDAYARVVIDAAVEVHRVLGPGFLESVYEEAMAVELALRGVPFRRQVPVALVYKGVPIGQARLDLQIADRLVVELKASDGPLPSHLAQLLSYLKATGQPLGLLINFNVPFLRQGIKRVIRTR
jgi:GxxExxY protein